MNVMIVGADHLGSISKNLESYGATAIEHVCGRNVADRNINIPPTTSLVVVLTDYINHGTAKSVKAKAKLQGIPAIFSRRSWCALEGQLAKFKISLQQEAKSG